MPAPPTIAASKHDRYLVAHAVFGAIAVLITLPLAMLLGRYLRTCKFWVTLHAILNYCTIVCMIICFALGNAALDNPYKYIGNGALHHKIGLTAFLLCVLQGIGGIGARMIKPPSFNYVTLQAGRSWIRYVHIFVGIATAFLLYASFYTGFGRWDSHSRSETHVPRGVRVLFWLLLGTAVFAYLLGWIVMEPLARKWRSRKLAMEQGLDRDVEEEKAMQEDK